MKQKEKQSEFLDVNARVNLTVALLIVAFLLAYVAYRLTV